MSEAAQETIGKILGESAQRDAVHFALAPIVATERLQPGRHVGIEGNSSNPIGIVDPFLAASVAPGDRFWMFLYPNTVTGLRHVYTHSVLDSEQAVDKAESESWLREFAGEYFYGSDEKDHDSYAELMKYAECGEFCFSSQPDWLYSEGAKEKQEMWKHLEIVRGRPFPYSHKVSAMFRCSC